ncbi:MAG TPA: hypothetical protein VMT85_06835, partial [Thermoanaerobaculia bacterium]|nr:hypothetical protein [Thermoanaerobaculia bacterium]
RSPAPRSARKPPAAPVEGDEEVALDRLHRELCARRRSLGGLPLAALTLRGSELTIRLAPGDLLRDAVERNRDEIEKVLVEHRGDAARLRVIDGEPRAIAEPAGDNARSPQRRARAAAKARADEEAVRAHPKVQAVLEIFATEIESIESIEAIEATESDDGGEIAND